MNPMTTSDGQVDQIIGSAYQVIKYVAANMETLISLAESVDPMVDSIRTSFEALRRTYAESGFVLLKATFKTGAAIGNRNHVLIDDTTGIAYSWGGALPYFVPQNSTLESAGGIGELTWIAQGLSSLREELSRPNGVSMVGGAASSTSVDSVAARAREALRRSYAEAGFNLINGSFKEGGTLTSISDVLLCKASGKAYSWTGAFPKVVAPGADPTSDTGYVPRSDVVLRGELESRSVTVEELSKLNVIVDDIIINVPNQYSTLQLAMEAIRNKAIQNTATVTIKIADGTYIWNSNQNLNHSNGDRIQIIGNQTTPENVTITTTGVPTFDMLSVTDGHVLGFLDGVYITTPTKATLSNNYTAILADNNSSIICGDKVKTNNWYYGIAARNGSFIKCRYANVANAGDVGIWAFNGSVVDAQHATVTAAIDATNSWGWGFEAEYGSLLDCSYGSATGCQRGGAGALSNSAVRALNFNGSSNIGSGLYAIAGGVIEAHNATLNSNARYGYEQELNGQIYGGNVTTSGNTIAPYSNYAYFDNSGVLGARIAANGSLRIDTNGANSIYFNTSGGPQFEVAHSASAVNRPYVQGSSYGSPVILGASGVDSVIDLALYPKGNGSYVRLGAGFTSSADVAVTGYIQVKDNNGTIRKLAIIA